MQIDTEDVGGSKAKSVVEGGHVCDRGGQTGVAVADLVPIDSAPAEPAPRSREAGDVGGRAGGALVSPVRGDQRQEGEAVCFPLDAVRVLHAPAEDLQTPADPEDRHARVGGSDDLAAETGRL